MECISCDGENVTYEVTERTNEGYVWETRCPDCGREDCGYEF